MRIYALDITTYVYTIRIYILYGVYIYVKVFSVFVLINSGIFKIPFSGTF